MTEVVNLNDLDFGVCTDDLSIKIVTISNDQVALKDNEFMNPFFVGLNHKGVLASLNEKQKSQFYSTYKRVLVMCTVSNHKSDQNAQKIFQMVLKKTDLQDMSRCFVLIPCTRRFLYGDLQSKRSIRVAKEHLNYFNHNNVALENEEIVVPMFELCEDAAKLHISLYENDSNASSMANILNLNNYYNHNFKARTQQQLSQQIRSIKESDYWSNPTNCNITMTEQFLKRSFQWKDILTDKVKNIIISKSANSQNGHELIRVLGKLANTEDGYQLVGHTSKPDAFTDIGIALQDSEKRTYYATVDNNELKITKSQVTEMFESQLTEREMYDLFNTLLVSKEYCHMVLNNHVVLSKMKTLISKYMPLYKYLMGYAWNAFYIEECLFKTKTTKNSRYIFDIKTANLLPFFPFSCDDLHQNPYMTTTISEKACDPVNNCMALHVFEDHIGYGIDTLDRFRWKFNLFTTGDPNKNIFDGLEWGNHYAISGSLMPAFLTIKSPLFDLTVNKEDPEYKQWLSYFNQYYAESDIDFMCNDDSVFDFMDSINNVRLLVEKNLSTPKEHIKVQVEPIRSTAIVIYGQYLTEKLDEIREYTCKPDLTVEQILSNLDANEVKEYFYGVYTDNKRKNNRIQRTAIKGKNNPLYEDYFKILPIDDINIICSTFEIEKDATVPKDSESCFYLNDFKDADKRVPEKQNVMLLKISETIKFKFRSEKMLHSIEAFRVKSNDFFSTVARFHLPCVRAYYNGENVYMTPSCITANLTGINIDYKYFAGVRDPIDILNKYRMRGFGTLLNATEKQHMTFYNGNVTRWSKMFNVDPKNKESVKGLYGFKDVNDNVFKPYLLEGSKSVEPFVNLSRKPVRTLEDLKKYYKNKHGYDCESSKINMFKFKTISPEGSINPLCKWVMDACYEN